MTKRRMGPNQLIVLKAIRDNPKLAYGKGLFSLAGDLFVEQIHMAIYNLNGWGFIRRTDQVLAAKLAYGKERVLYAITEKGLQAIKDNDNYVPSRRDSSPWKSGAEAERNACARMLDKVAEMAELNGKDFKPREASRLKIALEAIRDCAQMVREMPDIEARIDRELAELKGTES